MYTGTTAIHLANGLAGVEAVELEGLALLRRRRPRRGSWFPIEATPRKLADAALEMINYLDACQRCAMRLQEVRPIPSSRPVEEWPL